MKKILIVEDDADMRLSLHVRLKANQFETCFAADAASAILEARKNAPDLIILDLGLPAGGGMLVMERLKANPTLGATPTIVVSARDRKTYEPQALKAGARAFLQKPIDDKRLLSVIGRLLH